MVEPLPETGFDISVFCNVSMSNRDFFMTALYYLEALAAIAASLSVVTAGAWVVQQPTRDSGWGDTIWTLSLGLVGVGGALWPVGGAPPNARQWRYRDRRLRTSSFFAQPPPA
jgi:steroid 5-alpha reductase family enzyme